MPSKYQKIVELAAATTKEITSSSGRYMRFLTTAAHNFKYRYQDQLLIYAQKPDATACAEIDFWNTHGRWVNRGTRGIALLVEGNTKYRLRHVFDMSDTNSRDGHSVPVWRMQPRFEPAVMETLENSYGVSETTLADSLIATAKAVAADNLPDYLEQLKGVKAGSFLEELDELNTEVWLRDLLENSVAFMLLTRCGYDATDYYIGDDFSRIYDFNTPETMAVLGAAVSDTSEMVLREIAATVRSQRREEQKRNRTFDSRNSSGYNGPARTNSERSDDHGSDVQNRGGLSPAQPGRAGGSEGRKVWDAAARVPAEEQERPLHGDASQREAERAPGGSGPAGDRDGGEPDRADGESRGRDGTTESHGPDALGGPDEQHQGLGGGSGAERAGVRLTSEDKTALPDLSEARVWDFYNTVKQGHPDDMVLFQMGDFFELYGEDAQTVAEPLGLIPFSRDIPGVGRVTMCGVPAHSLERYVEQLRDKHDVTIVAVDGKTGERQVYSLPSVDREAEQAIDAQEAEYGADGTRVFRDPSADVPSPDIPEQYGRYKPMVIAAVTNDTPYRNACGHSDRENAGIECNAAVRRAILNSGDIQLIKLFSDVPEFRQRIHQEVFDETYPQLHELLRPLTQDDIDAALREWNGNEVSRQRVARYMADHARDESAAAWLAREYGSADENDLIVVRAESPESARLPWEDVRSRIARLVQEGTFLTESIAPASLKPDGVGPTGLQFMGFDPTYSDAPFYGDVGEKNELLRESDALKDHRVEVAAYFAAHEDNTERGEFVKGFFDNTLIESILSNDQRAGYRAWDNALTLYRGSYLSNEKHIVMLWREVAEAIDTMIRQGQWLDMDEVTLPTVAEQQQAIEQAEAEKASAFTLSQEQIDYLLLDGSGVEQGKYRIYGQFLKNEGKAENIKFLKDEYGIGGRSNAIPGTGYWEGHDGKGITVSRSIGDKLNKVVLSWTKVEKRIKELVAADRYLNQAEKEQYPAYRAQVAQREARWEIVKEYCSIIDDYIDFKAQLGEKDLGDAVWKSRNCAYDFGVGRKKNYVVKMEGEFVLPIMREALRTIIADNTHLTEQCEAMLTKLDSDIAKPMEPTADELAPPTPKEYKFALGDTVYLGSQEYEVLAYDESTVRLYDPTFPLFNTELSRTEFEQKLSENPLNDRLLQPVTQETVRVEEPPAEAAPIRFDADEFERHIPFSMRYKQMDHVNETEIHWVTEGIFTARDLRTFQQALNDYGNGVTKIYVTARDLSNYKFDDDAAKKNLAIVTPDEILDGDYFRAIHEAGYDEYLQVSEEESLLDNTKLFINEYCIATFEQEANFSDLRHVDLAFSSTSDSEHTVSVYADLVDFMLVYEVDGEKVKVIPVQTLWDPKNVLELSFDTLVADAESAFIEKQLNDGPETPSETEPETPDERFTVVETENGFAIWDDLNNDYYVDGDGVQEEFTSEWQANDYLEQVRKEASAPTQEQSEPAEEITHPYQVVTYHHIENGFDDKRDYLTLADAEKAAQGYVDGSFENDGFHYEGAAVYDRLEKKYIRIYGNFPHEAVMPEVSAPKQEQTTQAEKEELAPPAPRPRREKLPPTVIYPEIPNTQRHDFRITDDALGVGTPSERYARNVTAIRLLKELENEGRLATPEEQAVLSQYVGWGGLADCFDDRNSHYGELKALLSEDEYTAARESSLTAFYTPPIVIRAMYQALENLGFKTGNVLEPSCGVGNFIGMKPESLTDAKVYGVELDSISGRIAQQLYQTSSIAVRGFEKTELPDSFFDVSIGNVPFGSFKVPDRRYDKYNFLIHDYFFARTLDKVRPGGIVAFITSKGTMDKENPNVRKYIAQRADLLGAIRLPNNTFKAAAGTEVTSDILFLQKRESLAFEEPAWVHLGTDANGLKMNQYFIDNPDMVLGDMREVSGPFGPETACLPHEGMDLGAELAEAIGNINGTLTDYVVDDPEVEEDRSIPADPSVRNFSYTLVDGQIFYRENSVMNPVEVSVTAQGRIKGLIGIRDCVRTLIEYQTEDYPESEIKAQQNQLNSLYDAFVQKYGRINSRANSSAFSMDSAYFLLTSLEVLDDEQNFVRKADMFSRRTIRQRVVITSVDTASEALAVSLAEKAGVDLGYMASLMGGSEKIPQIVEDLKGVIFKDPLTGSFDMEAADSSWARGWQTADEYLSGNVRVKLKEARQAAEVDPDFAANVTALEAVQPVDLSASEISVRLGTTWLPPEVVEQFMFELLSTPRYAQWNIHVHYSQHTGEWNVEGKSYDRGNIKSNNTYGTSRINAYKIIETTLNLRDVRIFDYVTDLDGHRTPVLNKKETAIAQGKQELIKEAFKDWIWKDPRRRERLCRLYNDRFNSCRPREYDGSHINFVGMSPEITLRPHQVNAIAHILYGGNTLLAHVVGAGKTFEIVAAAMEGKRLGLCQKSLVVVPNHLTEQWASEWLQLYPSANILVATRKDFETKNRKRFCGRIATGDYDAIIIGHSQFEKIPMSVERQIFILEQERDEILDGIKELKANNGERFSIKQMEKSRKSIEAKLAKLNDQSRKDDVVTFEELGVDRLFVDEAHYFKNLAAFSKMRNVGGISQTEAQKSSDLYMKCRYLDELTGGKGVVFATGTPISNTMVEMFTMQKYLQYSGLSRNNLLHFDAWASTFGETVTAIELAPEGTGYRSKTRFSRFYNLPELMVMFKEIADIQTADMLNLPVPKANYHNVVLKPSEQQKEMVATLGERAERVRNRMVNSSEDNMLLITNDGRKLALDQRLLNPMLPDSETGKVRACADNVFEIWQRTAAERSTQMVFCDLSTPKNDGEFNVYDDLRAKLLALGIPAEEIAYVHNANTEVQKKELFGKVRSGQVRVLIGSTQKMGAGTNVQTRLIAMHHLDCPWRPSDLQQREGRIIRQGNNNPEVDIYTYVTEQTFDSYLYQLVEGKQKFIGQIMTSKSPVRSAEDIDETALSYAEIKALCTGDPRIKEKMDLDIDVQRLKLLKANHLSQKYALEDAIYKDFPQRIASYEQRIAGYEADMAHLAENTHPNADGFSPMEVKGTVYTDKKKAGTAIIAACQAMTSPDAVQIGQYRGFAMELSFDSFTRRYMLTLKNELRHTTELGTDIFGNILRLDNLLGGMEVRLTTCREELENTKVQLENAKIDVEKPFPQEEELTTKSARLDELNIALNLDKHENEIVDEGRDDDEDGPSARASLDMER